MRYIETPEGRMAVMPESMYKEVIATMKVGQKALTKTAKTYQQLDVACMLMVAQDKCKGYRTKRGQKA